MRYPNLCIRQSAASAPTARAVSTDAATVCTLRPVVMTTARARKGARKATKESGVTVSLVTDFS